MQEFCYELSAVDFFFCNLLVASSDIRTGPKLAACGDEIARNVAFTAPLITAVFSERLVFCCVTYWGCTGACGGGW